MWGKRAKVRDSLSIPNQDLGLRRDLDGERKPLTAVWLFV